MQSNNMRRLRIALAIGLAAIASALNALMATLFRPNFVYSSLILLGVWYLSYKSPRIARLSLLPLAAMAAIPPYPNWLYMDNDGIYHYGVTWALTGSPGALLGIFLIFLAIFSGIHYLIIRSASQA
jgi:hypothetical protein